MSTPNKRDDILQAALKLFAERGYDGTTVPMIADSAKVGAGTIYRYFENKEMLVNALFQQCIEQFKEALKLDAMTDTWESREQFRYIFHNLMKFANEHANALHFIDSHHHAYYLDEKNRELFEAFLSNFHNFLNAGKERGEIKPLDTNALICIVYGGYVSLFKLISLGIIRETPELLKDIETSCWDAIRVI